MFKSKIITRINPSEERWAEFVGSNSQANIFHHPAWINLLAECYSYRPFAFALIDKDDRIYAGLPLMGVSSFLTGRRLVSLPFTDYCFPLYLDGSSFGSLIEGLIGFSKEPNTPHIEVRWELPACPSIQSHSNYVRHTVKLDPDIESIMRSFHRTQRQNIKTAEKNDIQIERRQNLEGLREFYRLHCLTRRRHGVPVQPWRFFELLLKRVIEKDLGFILLAYAGGQCLAAGLFLHWQQTLSYKYAASSEIGQNLRPNHLLTWTAIRWGCENGFRIFDFGRTDVTNDGLRTFKNRWGAEETPLYYSEFSETKQSISGGRMMSLMTMIIKNSPPLVCRLAGELLYRHFG